MQQQLDITNEVRGNGGKKATLNWLPVHPIDDGDFKTILGGALHAGQIAARGDRAGTEMTGTKAEDICTIKWEKTREKQTKTQTTSAVAVAAAAPPTPQPAAAAAKTSSDIQYVPQITSVVAVDAKRTYQVPCTLVAGLVGRYMHPVTSRKPKIST